MFHEDVESFALDLQTVERRAEFLAGNENKKLGDVALIFCSDEYLLSINEEFLDHSYYTDIVTFDYSENSFISGDLFISVERVRDNATQYGITFYNELYRVIFHGLLHLAGYNDKTDAEQAEMRAKEDFYLQGMDFDKESI